MVISRLHLRGEKYTFKTRKKNKRICLELDFIIVCISFLNLEKYVNLSNLNVDGRIEIRKQSRKENLDVRVILFACKTRLAL